MSEAYIDCLRLDQYERQPFIAQNGWIAPKRDPSAKGFVFAIFDKEDALQFIGFSRDIRSSLRNMYYRQPEKCDGYRFVDLPELDKKQMASIRDAWLVQENGRIPPGLGDEKDLWLKAPKGDAATWDAMLKAMRSAGLEEEMEIDEAALERDGSIELLPSKHELTPQELEVQKKQELYDRENTFDVAEKIGKKNVEFEMYIALNFKTNGGRMFDVDITMNESTTSHRVTCSDHFLELVNVPAAEMLKRAFVYLFGNGCIRSTDRNTPTDIKDFPINYFSMNQIDQLYPGFGEMFPEGRVPRPDELWGFKRNTVSGSVLNEDKPLKGMPLLGPQYGEGGGDAQASVLGHGVEVELRSSVSASEAAGVQETDGTLAT